MVLNVILKWGRAFKSKRTFESFSGICVCVCIDKCVYIYI